MPSIPTCWKSETKPHRYCAGCGHAMALRSLGYVIDELKIQSKTIIGVDIGCSLLAWDFFDIDTIQTHHGRTTPVMVGLKMAQPEKIMIGYMGDGGGYAIGAQHLVNSAVRNDKITVILINNANYAMTGGQQAPTTMPGQITETTPYGHKEYYLKGPEMVKNINPHAFVARGMATEPKELDQLMKTALQWQIKNKGFSFLEILSPCPNNWRLKPPETLKFLEKLKKYYPLGKINGS